MGSREKSLAGIERMLREGRVDAALSTLNGLGDPRPGDLPALNRIGDALAKNGRSRDAVACYLRIAANFAASGFLPKAIAIYKKILRVDADHAESMFQLGQLFLKQELPGEARHYLLKTAEIFLRQERLTEARDVYQRLLATEPQNAAYRTKLAEICAAEGETDRAVKELCEVASFHLRSGEAGAAEEIYRRAAGLDPDAPAPTVGLAMALRAAGQDEAAFEYLDRATSLSGADADLTGELAVRYQEAGRTERAADLLFGPLAPQIAPETFESTFRLAIEQGQAARLWERFDPAIESWPATPDESLVGVLERLTALEEPAHVPALDRLVGVTERNGGGGPLVAVLTRLAGAYEAAGQTDELVAVRERLEALQPPEAAPSEAPVAPPAVEPAVEPEAPTLSGDAAERLRQAEAPAVPLNRSDEEFVNGRLTQAEILEKYGLLDQSIEQLREITERFPGRGDALERQVSLLRSRGAIGELRDSLVALAVARRAAGDQDGARGAVRQARQQAPIDSETQTMLRHLGLLDDDAPARPAAKPAPSSTPTPTPSDGSEVVIEFDSLGAPAEEEAPEEAQADTAPPHARDEGVLSVPADETDDDLTAITAALEEQLFEENASQTAPEPESEQSLDEVFAAFKRHVEEEVGSDDFRTHYDLAIAYKEMGLVDEAIEAFRLASQSQELHREACTMLALCHQEKGEMDDAAQWYRSALETPGGDAESQRNLRYDLAEALRLSGDATGALDLFRELAQADPSYRDVQTKVSDLEASQGS